jgi:hypothetical protein
MKQLSPAFRAAAALLAADLIMIVLEAGMLAGWLPRWTITLFSREIGPGEAFQYSKQLAFAVLLMLQAVRRRSLARAGWAALFVFFLIDYTLSVRFWLGEWVASALNLAAVIKWSFVHDVGELFAMAPIFALLFLPILTGYYTDSISERIFSLHMLLGFLAFVTISLGLDQIGNIWGLRFYRLGITAFENSVEMLLMSLWFSYLIGGHETMELVQRQLLQTVHQLQAKLELFIVRG